MLEDDLAFSAANPSSDMAQNKGMAASRPHFPDCPGARISLPEAVDDQLPSPGRDAALTGLLDDPSPAVRKALLAHFAAERDAARRLLQGLAAGPNRVLAGHARQYLDELRFSDPVAEFRTFIRSLNYELETGALLLSRTVYPNLDVAACLGQLDGIAARVRELLLEPSTPREKCRVLNRVLFHDCGFRGNVEHYTDPLNSFLPQVLARRKGIPLSLSLLYLSIARRIGLELEPVGLPGHFMVGCYADDSPFFIDPFEQGLFRSPEEVFARLQADQFTPKVSDLAPTPVREVLCRCCRNLVQHYTAAGDAPHARLFGSFVGEFEAVAARPV